MRRWLAAIATIGLGACGDQSSVGPIYPGANDAYWIPFVATAAVAGGEVGLFVVPSTDPTQAPIYITHSNVTLLAQAPNYSVSGSGVTGSSPAVIMYSANDARGYVHVYGLSLDNLGSPPTAVQISSLSIPAATLCFATQGQANLSRPETLFVILDIASASGCGTAQDTYLFVPFWASSSTPPTPLEIPNPYIQSLYAPDGTLGGMLISGSSGLYFYPDFSFTEPTVLLSGFKEIDSLFTPTPGNSGVFTTAEFVLAQEATGEEVMYQINYQGEATQLAEFDGPYAAVASDRSSFYFIPAQGQNLAIWRQRFAGGAPQRIGDLQPGAAYQPVSNGAVFVLDTEIGPGVRSNLTIFPVTEFTSTPALIATFVGRVTKIVSSPVPGDLSNALLFVTLQNFSVTSNPAGPQQRLITLSSEALTFNGTVRRPLTADSAFAGPINPFGGDLFEVTGIQSQQGGLGGGTLNYLEIATLGLTPFTVYGGGPYVIPSDAAGIQALSPRIGVISSGTDNGQGAIVYDASTKVVYPIVVANSTVAPLH
jgi:hypothetical protein